MEDQIKYLELEDVANMLKISTQTVRRLIDQGLPHYIVGKKLLRFEATKIHAWMNENERRRVVASSIEEE